MHRAPDVDDCLSDRATFFDSRNEVGIGAEEVCSIVAIFACQSDHLNSDPHIDALLMEGSIGICDEVAEPNNNLLLLKMS